MVDIYLFSIFLDLVLSQKCLVNVLDTSEYVGCFVDSRDRLLPHYTWLGSAPDNSRCILLCRDYGYMFAGTQNYDECYCGDNPWRYTAADVDPFHIKDYDCNYVCSVNSTEICGGRWRLSVYRTGVKNDHFKNIQSDTAHVERQYIMIGDDKKIGGNNTVLSSFNARSTHDCARLCSMNDVCSCFVYSAITGLCQLYWLDYGDLCDYTIYEDGSSVYMVD